MRKKLNSVKLFVLIAVAFCCYCAENGNENPLAIINFDGNEIEKKISSQPGFNIIKDDAHSGSNCLFFDYMSDRSPSGMSVLELSEYISINGGGEYRIAAWVKIKGVVRGGGIYLGARFKGSWNGPVEKWQKIPIPSSEEWELVQFSIRMPKVAGVKILPIIGISKKASGGQVYWDDVSISDCSSAPCDSVVHVAPLGASVFFQDSAGHTHDAIVYDYESRAFVSRSPNSLSLTISGNVSLEKAWVTIKIKRIFSDNIVSTISRTLADGNGGLEKVVQFSVADLPVGHYCISVSVMNREGSERIGGRDIDLIINKKEIWDKITSGPLEGIKTSGIRDGFIYINEKRHNLMHLYHVDDVGIASSIRSNFGITSMQVRGIKPANMKKIDDIWSQGIYSWIVLHDSFDLSNYRFDENMLRDIIIKSKDHPGVIGWMLFDEPDSRNNDFAMRNALESAIKAIRDIDKGKPIWVNLCEKSKFNYFANVGDIASYDYYPFPNGNLSTVEEWNKAIIATSNPQRPFVSIQQMWSPFGERAVTNGEIRVNAYLCMIQGMRNFSFYSWSEPGPFWNQIEMNAEVQSWLKNAVYEATVMLGLLNDPAFNRTEVGRLDDGIRFLLAGNGVRACLIAVNIGSKPISFSLSVNKNIISPSGKCVAPFEDGRPIEFADGVIGDRLKSGDARFYEITNQ